MPLTIRGRERCTYHGSSILATLLGYSGENESLQKCIDVVSFCDTEIYFCLAKIMED